jgi:hypothetical protein
MTAPSQHHEAGDREAQRHFLGACWRIGDALAVSVPSGIPYPRPEIPQGLDVDEELAFLVQDAQQWINGVYLHHYAGHRSSE